MLQPPVLTPSVSARGANQAGYVDGGGHHSSVSASACLAACCGDLSCTAYTFTAYQPHDAGVCPAGTRCCWLKQAAGPAHPLVPKANCTSGVLARPPPPRPPPPSPSPYYTPALDFVSIVATRTDGNLRDPSAAVQDPVTGLWHFWVDYMPGATQPGWHAELHHYVADSITGPWRSKGKCVNHSTDPKAWDYAGQFSPSGIYSPHEEPPMWYRSCHII